MTGGDLRGRVLAGVRWSAGAYYAALLVRLAAAVVLARLLDPADFGRMALAMAFVGVVALVQESGLQAALVQYRGPLPAAAGAVTVLTACAGLGLAGLLIAAAPAAATVVGMPDLVPVLQAAALACPVRALGHAPRALLQRAMAFRTLAGVELAGVGVYAAVGLVLAARGHGVWSLVAAQVASEAALSAGVWWWCPERPRPAWPSRALLADLTGFGRHVMAANLLGLVHQQLPALIVGATLGPGVLGLYGMAQRWASLPVQGITYVAARVAYPALASLRGEPERLRRAYLGVLRGVLVLAVPCAVGLALVAAPLVAALYDARWQPAVAALRLLALYGLLHATAATTGEAFKAAGAPRWVAVYAAVYDVVLGLGLWQLGTWSGLEGVALATVLAPAVVLVLSLATLCRTIGLAATAVVRAAAAPCAGAVTMAIAVAAIADAGRAPGLELALRVLVGAAAYGATLAVVDREALRELAAIAGWRPVPAAAHATARGHGGVRAALALGALVLATEAGLRLAARGVSAAAVGPWVERRPWEALRALEAPGVPSPVPGGVARWRLQPWNAPVEYRLDGDGFRTADGAAAAGTGPVRIAAGCRVLVVGDSTAFGYGVPAHDALPARLGAALAADGRAVAVRNAGVCAANAAGLVRWTAEAASRWPADVVVLVVSPWSLRLDAEPSGGAGLGARAWAVLAPGVRAVSRWSAVGERVAAGTTTLASRTLGWPPPGTVAWELAPLREAPEAFAARWLGLEPVLDALVERAGRGGAAPVVVFVPLDVQVSRARNAVYRDGRLPYPSFGFVDDDYTGDRRHQRAVAAWAARQGIALLDATAVLAEAGPGAFLPDDYHLAPAGHARLADALAPITAAACTDRAASRLWLAGHRRGGVDATSDPHRTGPDEARP